MPTSKRQIPAAAATHFGGEEFSAFLLDAEHETSCRRAAIKFCNFSLKSNVKASDKSTEER